MIPSLDIASLCLASLSLATLAPGQDPIAGTIEVPIDHSAPDGGTLTLAYELGAPFDPELPTILAVADG